LWAEYEKHRLRDKEKPKKHVGQESKNFKETSPFNLYSLLLFPFSFNLLALLQKLSFNLLAQRQKNFTLAKANPRVIDILFFSFPLSIS
jgi:hypothetical protein